MLENSVQKLQGNSTLARILRKILENKAAYSTNSSSPSKNIIPKDQKVISSTPFKFKQLLEEQNEFLDRLVRVDQAGELGANYIYQGQIFSLVSKYPHLRPVLNHMWEQEVHHHNTFNEIQRRHRVRPLLMTPFWKIGAIALGATTGMILKEAAMACTVAVETVIGGHYNSQLRVLLSELANGEVADIHGNGTGEIKKSDEMNKLMDIVKEFRDQELDHLNTAVEHDAEKAVPYLVITELIKSICRVSINVAERV